MTEKKTKKGSRSKKDDVNDMNFWELKLYIVGKTPKSNAAI